ncbi:uncharacterized protein LOC143476132 [Brachyhypopomus gauderio]|uniref:uncharacterized protein LOC143476132 n=1 Tax=Brachyhypopomus gauderio TaxID=698409 RepID=UPI004041AC0F
MAITSHMSAPSTPHITTLNASMHQTMETRLATASTPQKKSSILSTFAAYKTKTTTASKPIAKTATLFTMTMPLTQQLPTNSTPEIAELSTVYPRSKTEAPPMREHLTTTNQIKVTAGMASIIHGSAVVETKLVFDSSFPVPSESVVLNATRSLLSSRKTKITDSVTLLNITYEKITDTSFAVVFIYSLNNISMPDSTNLNNTYDHVQNIINTALNTLLNDLAEPIQPQNSFFITLRNKIEGIMEYNFQDGDAGIPVSFLNELTLQSASPTIYSPVTTSKWVETSASTPSIITTTPSISHTALRSTITPGSTAVAAQATTPQTLLGTVLIYIRVVFKNMLTLPSEAQVLTAYAQLNSSLRAKRDITTLKLNNPVSIQNITYLKINSTSYSIGFAFKISDVPMAMNIELRNKTYNSIEQTINDLLDKILSRPGASTFVLPRYNFSSNNMVIVANTEYVYERGDINSPSRFLAQILQDSGVTFTTTPAKTATAAKTTISPTLLGTVLMYISLVFKNLTTLPSEDQVLTVANAQLDSSIKTIQDIVIQKLNNPVSIKNIIYQKIDKTSFSINFTFEISQVPLATNIQLRNGTYVLINNAINSLLNIILNNPNVTPFVLPQLTTFLSNYTVIVASIEYDYMPGDINSPSGFLSHILQASGLASTTTSATATLSSQSPLPLSGTAMIYIEVVIKNFTHMPSETEFLTAYVLLDPVVKTQDKIQNLNDPKSIQNATLQIIDSTSFSINFGFKLNNVPMSSKTELNKETYDGLQQTTNNLMNKILTKNQNFTFPSANITIDNMQIMAKAQYVYVPSDINFPSNFLAEILQITGLASGGAWWVLGIIIPCAIAIFIVPCWILLCCILCGWCAAIRRRYNRRRSYSIQYTTRNGLF